MDKDGVLTNCSSLLNKSCISFGHWKGHWKLIFLEGHAEKILTDILERIIDFKSCNQWMIYCSAGHWLTVKNWIRNTYPTSVTFCCTFMNTKYTRILATTVETDLWKEIEEEVFPLIFVRKYLWLWCPHQRVYFPSLYS